MALLGVLVTHLPADAVAAGLRYLEAVAPSSEFVVAHGGKREDFDEIATDRKVFIDDPLLRAAPVTVQSYNQLLTRVHDAFVRDDPRWRAVLVLEYDQLVLREDFEATLLGLLETSGADFLGKNCVRRDGTNWLHFLRYRDDPGLLAFLRGISVREDRTAMFGCLGTGMVLRREVLTALATMEHHEPVYVELYLPTVVHHLGFRVEDVNGVSDLYDELRWAPVFTEDEVVAAKRRGRTFVHPFKEWTRLEAIARS